MPKKDKGNKCRGTKLIHQVHCSSSWHGAGDEGKGDAAKEEEGIFHVAVHTARIP